MLRGIPMLINPDLLKVLHEMGHGNEIVVCDANCPAKSYNSNYLRCDALSAPELVDAILTLMPLDTYQQPVYLMEKVPGDQTVTENWGEYQKVIEKHSNAKIEHIERFAFYERMRNASAVVVTADPRPYGNIILKKGVF